MHGKRIYSCFRQLIFGQDIIKNFQQSIGGLYTMSTFVYITVDIDRRCYPQLFIFFCYSSDTYFTSTLGHELFM
eukprot:UN08831